jgi:hypothetical protein
MDEWAWILEMLGWKQATMDRRGDIGEAQRQAANLPHCSFPVHASAEHASG